MADALAADAVPPVDATDPELQDPSERPSFIPYDTPPRLTNPSEIVAAMRQYYPRALRDAGIGGRVEVWLFVDKDGSVMEDQVKTSSGEPALDAAARIVMEQMKFQPAEFEGQPAEVWVSQWITFEVEPSEAAPKTDALPDGSDGDTGVDGDDPRRIILKTDGGRLELVPQSPDGEVLELGAEPLIVIDGVIQAPGTPVEDLDPDDIESVEVIKGAAAARLYGDRGANGVVQITTKSGAAP